MEMLDSYQREDKDSSMSMMSTSKDTSKDRTCMGHDHFPVDVLKDNFDMSVHKMFETIFTDSPVQRMLAQRRKRKDVVWFPWRSEANGDKRRNLSYVVSTHYKLRPKSFRFTEKQVLYSESQPGIFYFVDAECMSENVPYGDCFSVVYRCYISRISDDKCHLCITCRIKYYKNVWTPVKNFISKRAAEGVAKNFLALAELLRKEDSGSSEPSLSSSSTQISDSDTSVTPICVSSSCSLLEASPEYLEDTSFFSTGFIYFVFTCSLFCVACIVGVLFYGLSSSVDINSFTSVKGLNDERMSHVCHRSPAETQADELASHLSEMLSSSTKLLETAAESLEELKEDESKMQQCPQEKKQSSPNN